MRFTKMQGCGNDYIYVNCFEENVEDPSALAVKLSDRHFGIGSDGLILIEPSEKADAYMHMFNKDGTEGRMCGNGIRCTAKYIYDHGIIPPERGETHIETAAGIKKVVLNKEDGKVKTASVDMGIAEIDSEEREKLIVDSAELYFTGIDIGNPHAVFFLEDNPDLIPEGCDEGPLESLHLEKIGPEIENSARFPDKVNAEFIETIDRSYIRMRVWERGSGETMACGTGACASVAAGNITGRLDTDVKVELPGGHLYIKYDRDSGSCTMTGPCVEVFEGNVSI